MMISRDQIDFLSDTVFDLFDVIVNDETIFAPTGIIDQYLNGKDLEDIVKDLICSDASEDSIEEFRGVLEEFVAKYTESKEKA